MENLNEKLDDNFNMENIAANAFDNIKPNRVLQGEVVTIDNDFVYVNVGTKSDGRVGMDEFAVRPRVGDVLDIMLVNKRMIDGMYLFSHAAALKEKGWKTFFDSYKKGSEYVSGKIVSTGEKGIIIDCQGIHAFLPFSQAADIKMKKDTTGAEYLFKIKNVDEKKRAILLSRRDYLDEQKEKVWGDLSANYKPGDRIKGKVVRFVDFGAFIDIGGIEGLLYKDDISWRRVFKKKNILKLGEEREFMLLDIRRDEGKISLGLKQLAEDPWLRLNEKYHVGDTIEGRVVNVINPGAFVEFEDGVEGFLSAADMSWTKKASAAKDVLSKGQKVTVKVIGVNSEERKLSLGLKQLLPNPWDTLGERFPVGSVHRRPVKKIVSFGMFVELEDDIDGLIHLSDISWDDGVKEPAAIYKNGDEVEFKILDIRKEEMKISCGIKQMMRSPWEAIKEKYPPRSRLSGTVTSVMPFGLFVKLDDDVEGLVHITEVSRKKIDSLEGVYSPGDQVNVVVLGVDAERKRLSLSIKHFDMMVEKEELSKILNNTSSSRVTIGDIIKMKQGE